MLTSETTTSPIPPSPTSSVTLSTPPTGLPTDWTSVVSRIHQSAPDDATWALNVVRAVAILVPNIAGVGLLVLEHSPDVATVKVLARATSSAGGDESQGLEDDLGWSSTAGIVVHPETGIVISLCALVREGAVLTRYERMLLARIAFHVETSYRLARSGQRNVRAELDANGRVIQRGGEPLLDLWASLTGGRVSLVEQGQRGSRHYFVVDAHPAVHAGRALSGSEITVLAHAARGEPAKFIAYTLGIRASTVSLKLASAAAKLGVASSIELVRIAAMLSMGPRCATHDSTLTDAEHDVLELLQHGLSNAEIATMRGRSVRTVANQVASLLRKTKSPSRRGLIALVRVSA